MSTANFWIEAPAKKISILQAFTDATNRSSGLFNCELPLKSTAADVGIIKLFSKRTS